MKKLLIISLLILQSCSNAPLFMKEDQPGSAEFKMGWNHGCDSVLATYGTLYNKMFHAFYQDYEMLSNPDYDTAWHEAFNYCRHYNLKWNTHDATAN